MVSPSIFTLWTNGRALISPIKASTGVSTVRDIISLPGISAFNSFGEPIAIIFPLSIIRSDKWEGLNFPNKSIDGCLYRKRYNIITRYLCLQLIRRTHCDYLPPVYYRHPVAEGVRLVHIMGCKEHCHGVLLELPDKIPYNPSALRIQAHGRLVEK